MAKRMFERVGIVVVLAGFLIGGSSSTILAATTSTDANKPTTQKYPGALAGKASQFAPAADAIQNVAGQVASGKPTNEPLAAPLTHKPVEFKPQELTNERDEFKEVQLNKDGSKTIKKFFAPRHFKKEGKWEKIDSTLVEDKNAGDAGTAIGKAFGKVESIFKDTTNYIVNANEWQARFAPSDFGAGMVRIKQGNDQIGFKPIGAKDVAPEIKTIEGKQQVTYKDLWSGVDVVYTVHAAEVKESLIFKNKSATNEVKFELIGANLSSDKELGYKLDGATGALKDKFAVAPANLILNKFGMVTESGRFSQQANGKLLTTSINADYLANLPSEAFPAVIDPPIFVRSNFGSRAGGNYQTFKSDGYVCASNVCNLQAGALVDSNYYWRYWRGAFFSGYNEFRNPDVKLLSASVQLTQRTNAPFYTGYTGPRYFSSYHATCLAYNCAGQYGGTSLIATSGAVDVTPILASAIARGDFGAWLMIIGEEYPADTYKNFDPDNSYLQFAMNYIPPIPSFVQPEVDGRVYIDPQPTFKVNPVADGNGDPVKYEFRVSSGGSGLVINSGLLDSPIWTVPDGVIQDGSTYTLQAFSNDGFHYSNPATRTFKVDMRQGKDKTQTYDELGPVSVDLSTGNLSTSENSHSSDALGGKMGVSLDYNSPVRSRTGVVAEYWNVSENHNGSTPTGNPVVKRVEPNINYNWGLNAPANSVNPNWFYARWTGYFTAPKAGTYNFGASNDDGMSIYIDDQKVYDQGCYSGACYGATGVTLQEGQVVKLRVEYMDATGNGYAIVMVRGAVAEQILPQQWLQTGVRPVAQNKGLTLSLIHI